MDIFKIFGRKKENSKNVAKERLKLVLVHDRADLSQIGRASCRERV